MITIERTTVETVDESENVISKFETNDAETPRFDTMDQLNRYRDGIVAASRMEGKKVNVYFQYKGEEE